MRLRHSPRFLGVGTYLALLEPCYFNLLNAAVYSILHILMIILMVTIVDSYIVSASW